MFIDVFRRLLSAISALAVVLVVSACGVPMNVPMQYVPQTLEELPFEVGVQTYVYDPTPEIPQNQLEGPCCAIVELDKSVGEFVSDALKLELRQADARLVEDTHCTLTGVVHRFRQETTDPYILNITHVLLGDGTLLYEKIFHT